MGACGDGRSRPRRRKLGFEALCAREVALPDKLGEESFVCSAVGKVAVAAHPQRLIDGLLEAKV